MENNLEFIKQFYKGETPAENKEFEKRVTEDPVFAEEAAFYLSALQAAKQQLADEKKQRFRELYEQQRISAQKQSPVRRLWPYAAAAAMIAGVVLCWFLFLKPPSAQQLAENYIRQNFETLGVTMGNEQNQLQKGLAFYNSGSLKEALQQFEILINLDSTDFAAKKYAGITALRLRQYNKALHYFKLLKDQPGLYANPGAFLQAITLLKRNLPGDKQAAKALLQEVVQKDWEGRETAEQWLKK
jgi:tetratricopeptide (TPR) repeat protein